MTKPKAPVIIPTRIAPSGRIIAEVRPGRWLDERTIRGLLGYIRHGGGPMPERVQRYQAALKAIETLADACDAG